MSTNNHGLSQQQTELVALGASVGAGCQPCVDYHLKAARTAELAADRVRAAITTGQLVAAQAADSRDRSRRITIPDQGGDRGSAHGAIERGDDSPACSAAHA